jgi:hypothetical protein
VTLAGLLERVGFDPLNAEPCTALHGLVQTYETKHLSGFRPPPDLIDMFSRLIRTEDVAQQWKM